MSKSKNNDLTQILQEIDPVFVKLVTGGYYGMLTNAGISNLISLIQTVRPEYHLKTIQRHLQNPLKYIPKNRTKFYFELYGDCLAQVLQDEVKKFNDLEYRKQAFKEIINEYKQLKSE